MKIIRIFMPGRFDDASVYMGWLSTLTQDRTLKMYNLEQVMSRIDSRYSECSPVATYLFARNDWLTSAQFKLFMKNPEVSGLFMRAIDRFPRHFVFDEHVNLCDVQESPLELRASSILDMQFYNTRLYVGTTDGLYDSDVDWDDARLVKGPNKRLDAKCLNISARYGALNASCGNDGLFCYLDEFGYLASSEKKIRRLDKKSIRTGWASYDVLNYSDNRLPKCYKTSHEKSQQEYDRTLITDIYEDNGYMSGFEKLLHDNFQINLDNVQFTFNSNNYMFIHTYSGEFFSLFLERKKNEEPKLVFHKTYKGYGTRILSAAACKTGTVIETDNNVFLFAKDQWYSLIDQPVLSVRTFITSKRFQNLIAITTEEGVHLISTFDETAY